MKAVLMAVAITALGGAAYANIPELDANCPTGIEVHAAKGGPIFINGHEAALTTYNRHTYDATHGGVTVSLSINRDKSVSVTYTRQNGANGICQVDFVGNGGQACPSDISEANRADYPGCN